MTLQPIMQETQESVLKNRMAIDDRPLRRLIKKFSTLLVSSSSFLSSSLSLNQSSFQAELTSYRTTLQRLLSISSCTLPLETALYTRELESILTAQAQARDEIVQLKATLASAKLQRKQKLDYDRVASNIYSLPSRQQLHASLQALSATLHGLTDESDNLAAVATNANQRLQEVVTLLERLAADVGEEVGSRERREVQRDADGDNNDDDDDDADTQQQQQQHQHQQQEEEEQQHAQQHTQDSTTTLAATPRLPPPAIPRSNSTLNASAAPFLPPSTATTTSSSSATVPRSKRPKGDPQSDEEGQLDDLPPPSSSLLSPSSRSTTTAAAASKKVKLHPNPHPQHQHETEEGEAIDEDDEEGSILPPPLPPAPLKRAAPKSNTRSAR